MNIEQQTMKRCDALKPRLISDFQKGTIKRLLIESYQEFNKEYPQYLDENLSSFSSCDSFFYNNIQIGNRYAFISVLEEKPIGMICWDPRNKPIGEIGHNCIIPKYRNKGFGEVQLYYALKRIKELGMSTVKVSTGIMEYFIPAQKMYRAV